MSAYGSGVIWGALRCDACLLCSRAPEWRKTYILVSLVEAPPAIFCVRSWTSSCLRLSSWTLRSSLFLPQRDAALTFAEDYRKFLVSHALVPISNYRLVKTRKPYHLVLLVVEKLVSMFNAKGRRR